MEVLRRRKPPANIVCARDRKPLTIFEITDMREVEPARAAHRGR